MPLRPYWASPPHPARPECLFGVSLHSVRGRRSPGFPWAWHLLSEDTSGDTELPGITALNVMGVFVTDVKRLTLTIRLRGQEAGVSSPLAAGTQAGLSHYGGSPSSTVSLSHGQPQPKDVYVVSHRLPHTTWALCPLTSPQEGPVRGKAAFRGRETTCT